MRFARLLLASLTACFGSRSTLQPHSVCTPLTVLRCPRRASRRRRHRYRRRARGRRSAPRRAASTPLRARTYTSPRRLWRSALRRASLQRRQPRRRAHIRRRHRCSERAGRQGDWPDRAAQEAAQRVAQRLAGRQDEEEDQKIELDELEEYTDCDILKWWHISSSGLASPRW